MSYVGTLKVFLLSYLYLSLDWHGTNICIAYWYLVRICLFVYVIMSYLNAPRTHGTGIAHSVGQPLKKKTVLFIWSYVLFLDVGNNNSV